MVLVSSGVASAQEPVGTLPRGDAWGSFGWALGRTGDEDAYLTRGTRRIIGGVGGGVYWSPNLKFEIDTSTPNRHAVSRFEHTSVGTVQTYRYLRTVEDRWGVAAVQQYEFLPNSWFSPYAGVGVEVGRRTREDYLQGVTVYDTASQPGRVSDQFLGEQEIGSERGTVVRPLVTIGFKGYMTRRAFFRSDARVTFHNGVDEVKLRFGFGVDF